MDEETGYYYYNARHYDAALARFVTADTVIDGEYSVAGWNRYMYCAGNPVLYKDPSGHAVADAYLDEESQSGLRNHSINFNYDWNRNDSIKNLTMKGHQGDAGRLAKAISRQMEVPIGDRETLGTPNRLAKSACVIASLYVDMKMAGFDVENDIGAFMTRHIDDGDVSDLNSYVYPGGKNNILSKYQIEGDYRTYGARHKIERVTDYDTFLSMLDGDGNIGKHGVVRINGHNFNVYNNDGTIRTSDVGHQDRHGKAAVP